MLPSGRRWTGFTLAVLPWMLIITWFLFGVVYIIYWFMDDLCGSLQQYQGYFFSSPVGKFLPCASAASAAGTAIGCVRFFSHLWFELSDTLTFLPAGWQGSGESARNDGRRLQHIHENALHQPVHQLR